MPGSLLRVVDGQKTPSKRPAAPHLGGPLGSSGAAPEDVKPASEPAVPEDVKPGSEAVAPEDMKPASEAAVPAKLEPAVEPAQAEPVVEAAKSAPAAKPEGQAKPDETNKPEELAKPEEPAKSAEAAKLAEGADKADKTDAAAKTTESAETTVKPSEDEPAKPSEDKTGKDGPADGMTAPSAAAPALSSGGRATRVLRKANPARVARSTSDWAKRPSGRFVLPAIIAVLLLGAAGTAGAYLVPQALQSVPAPSATPTFGTDAGAPSVPMPGPSGLPSLPGLSSAPAVVGGGLPATPPVGIPGARPADALSGWAQQTGTRVGIPVVAVQAYGYAELVVGRTAPTCHLSWTTIAAIAKVESAHGSANGAVLGADGSVSPPIFGLPLDGKGGRQLIPDTDQGLLDKDAQFDRAIGPLQFIPQTWNEISVGNAVDADNNGVSDPNDIDDASLATAVYLCKGGRDLSKADAWWDAILSYNAVRPYAQKVYDAANEYGVRSRV